MVHAIPTLQNMFIQKHCLFVIVTNVIAFLFLCVKQPNLVSLGVKMMVLDLRLHCYLVLLVLGRPLLLLSSVRSVQSHNI